MLTRKTQYAWMAMGGLICLFGLILACKLRDGNKAVAQDEKNSPPPLPLVEAPLPPMMPPAAEKAPKTEKKLPAPLLFGRKKESKQKKAEPKVVFDGPMTAPATSSSPPFFSEKPPSSPTPPLPTPSYNGMSSSNVKPSPFGVAPPAMAGERKEEKKKDDGVNAFRNLKVEKPSWNKPRFEPDTKSADAKPLVSPPVLMNGTAPPPALTSGTSAKSLPPSMPLPLSGSTTVKPTSFAPVSAAPASPDHDAKVQPGEPPLAPAPGPVQTYRAKSSETLQDIARRTLGNGDRVSELHKLNPTLRINAPLGVGTVVRLPVDACVQTDDASPVKPLPALRAKPTPPKAKVLPLTGTYQCSLDEKGQLTLPRALRDQFGDSDTVLLSPGPDKCLWLTNQPHLERLGERLEQSRAHEADVRVFKRLYFAQTEKLPVNDDGRVALPDRLCQFAGLHQELVLVGIDDHFEVWDAARWRSYTQQKSGPRSTLASDE